jgi:hypothetical protein
VSKCRVNLNAFYTNSIISYILCSLFMSGYFYKLPSFLKEIVLFPAALFFIISIWAHLKIKANYLVLIYLILLVIFCVIGVINEAPDKFALRYYFIPIIIFLIVRYQLKFKYQRRIENFLYYYLALMLAVGAIEIYNNINALINLFKGIDVLENLKIIRSYLFFLIPNLAGLSLAAIILFIYLSLNSSKKKTIILILSLILLFYVFSRTAILALIISVVLYHYFNSKLKYKIYLIPFIVFLGIYLYQFSINDEAFIMRIDGWTESTIPMISGLGEGIGFISTSSTTEEGLILDNDVLRFIYEIGIVGFISFSIFLFYQPIRDKNIKAIAYAIFILLNMTMGDCHSMYPGVTILYICLALLLNNPRIIPREECKAIAI